MQQICNTAYLIIRQGGRWNDVFRLQPEQKLIIGRASTNQIVVPDDRCSRHHAEIAPTPSGWIVRDLGSRNGTLVGSHLIEGDHVLAEGDQIQVASCSMTFVHQLNQAFQANVIESSNQSALEQTQEFADPHCITHRRRDAVWLKANTHRSVNERADASHVRVATQLFQLAYDLARETTPEAAAQLALDRVLAAVGGTAGGILLRPPLRSTGATTPGDNDMLLVATHEREGRAYHRLSDMLFGTILREGQAILARNVQEDTHLNSAQESAARRTTSVLVAPIRESDQVVGIIHIYSSEDESMFSPDQLEIAIAAADTLAIAIHRLRSERDLSIQIQDRDRKIQILESQLIDQLELVGQSPPMQRIQQQIARVGPAQATILVRGESGVGKELVARAIHLASPRANMAFVAINCAALAPTLLESELFGHEKGAFTGATERKIGKFELAHGGTLLLDEIGEMSSEIQAKFLRALEGKPFERLGGSKPIVVDVRVVAATNRDLEKAVKEGHFRSDLYFRLRVIELTVPSLRERRDDILPIAEYYLAKFLKKLGHGPTGFSSRAKKAMLDYAWPGNIRELKNAIERAAVLSSQPLAEPEDLALSHLGIRSAPNALESSEYRERSLEDVEREHILATLAATQGHKSKTASILGVERSTLDRKLRKYGVEDA